MSATIGTRIQLKRDTTEHWNEAIGFIPLPGEVIVYEDYETKTYTVQEYGETVTKTVQIPNIKIGTGNAYVQDLAFVDEKTRDILMAHIRDNDIHVTLQEKLFWNNKINVDDAEEQITGELDEETLILNRN
jgi:hypothetical protein